MNRIRVSANGHYLITDDGEPFFWLGDTAWDLIHHCSRDDAAMYFAKRASQGFTVVQAVALAERDGLRTDNANGDRPFLDLGTLDPNPRYFDWIAELIELAASHGIYFCLLPTWGDKVTRAWGTGPQIFTAQNIESYGAFVGERFAGYDNLIWMIGGDRTEILDGVDYRPVWRALAKGVRTHAGQLMTYHPKGGQGSSREFLGRLA